MTASLHDALPEPLRGAGATITPISAGLSGAGVYRVDAAGAAFVLKIAAADAPVADWRRHVAVLRVAADSGLAPAVVHTDEDRRAVLTAFVQGRMFAASLRDPQARATSLATLGEMIRRVHGLPVPVGATVADPRGFTATLWSRLVARTTVPAFSRDIVEALLAADAPLSDRDVVLSHNDMNPSNLLEVDGRLCLLDWDAAGTNDPFYDLATVSLFFRMDAATSRALLASYDPSLVGPLPAAFVFTRRVVATLSGVAALDAACRNGHSGATGDESLNATPTLDDVYGRLRDGTLMLATAEGQWTFGLALLKSSLG